MDLSDKLPEIDFPGSPNAKHELWYKVALNTRAVCEIDIDDRCNLMEIPMLFDCILNEYGDHEFDFHTEGEYNVRFTDGTIFQKLKPIIETSMNIAIDDVKNSAGDIVAMSGSLVKCRRVYFKIPVFGTYLKISTIELEVQ